MLLSSRFTEVLAFAARLHRNQVRKGPGEVPYLAHLLATAALVLEYGGGEDEAVAAVLHDAVEDQGGAPTREIINRLFGERVAAIVDGCTDSGGVPKPPWRERKERFLEGLRAAPPDVLLVTLADKLSNVRSTIKSLRESGDEVWRRFRGGEGGTLWYYRAVLETVHPPDARVKALWSELGRAVAEMENLASSTRKPG